MNEKAFKTLEYNKIIDLLTEQAASLKAKELCRSLKPMTDKGKDRSRADPDGGRTDKTFPERQRLFFRDP